MFPTRWSPSLCIPTAMLTLLAASSALGQIAPQAIGWTAASRGESRIVELNTAAIADAAADGKVVLDALQLDSRTQVALELERVALPPNRTQYVLGRPNGADAPLDFDPAGALVLRGTVAGRPGSRAFIALTAGGGGGYVDLGTGVRYVLSTTDLDGSSLGAGRLRVRPAIGAASRPPGLALCGADEVPENAGLMNAHPGPVGGGGIDGLDPVRGPRIIDIAVETDNELFNLFGNAQATAAYVTALYAEVDRIYVRDVNTHINLVFVRIWDTWNDLFNQPDPLGSFRSYWNNNMQAVQRDVAQFFSGRRDVPWGGVAYLRGLCNNNSYSCVGYAIGFFPDPEIASVYTYDVSVVAHEIGHNFAAPHTHDRQLDNCGGLNNHPQRGTIMAYCSQTVSGGNAVTDNRFDGAIQLIMEDYLANDVTCAIFDCNGNGLSDTDDIAGGTSMDVNGDGIPDECQDCNGNGTLDPDDIAGGTSLDLNGDGMPDECQPDCNGNMIPDDLDIASGTSLDVYRNNIPDECEADCDGNGTADVTDINLDMTLDVNRDRIIDACQDCDGDGTIDLIELNNAHAAWLAGHEGGVKAFQAATGVVSGETDPNRVNEPMDVIVTPDARVLVTSSADHRVVEFARDGSYLRDLVTAGSGGLNTPTGLVLAPGGSLLVSSAGSDSVLEYDAATGAFIGEFVAAGAGGLVAPFGLTYGPSGHLYVTSDDGRVLEFDGDNGAFIRALVTFEASGGLEQPRGLTFTPAGTLLVCSFANRLVLEYDGETGQLLRKFNNAGTDIALTMHGPWGVRIGPSGLVYISRHYHNGNPGGHPHPHPHEQWEGGPQPLHVNSTRIYEFKPVTGEFLRSYVTGNDTGLNFSTGFDFMPGWDIDCNQNQLPDDCDIASGFSPDANGNGVPDECEIDCNGNGTFDRLDIWPYGESMDCNGNGLPDECDIADGTSEDCNRNGRPDECEGTTVVYDNMERDGGWTTEVLGATAGQWQRGIPVNDPGWDYDPAFDADFGGQAWLTQNELGNTDVDGGAVRLTSPRYDMSAGRITIRYEYYLVLTNSNGADRLLVEINSNDGAGPWIEIARHAQNGGNQWNYHEISQQELNNAGVTLTSTMRMRFTANDADPQSIVEAGLDTLHITSAPAEQPHGVGDLNCDCSLNAFDIEAFITALVEPQNYAARYPGCDLMLADINGDGAVDSFDIEPFIALLVGP